MRYPIQRSGVRLASTGTSVTATHPATTSAARAVVLASARLPVRAAAPEYNASTSATLSATIARKKARTPGRSAFSEVFDSALLGFTGVRGRNRRFPATRLLWFRTSSAATHGACWLRRDARTPTPQAV